MVNKRRKKNKANQPAAANTSQKNPANETKEKENNEDQVDTIPGPSMQINQSTESNVTLTEKNGKNDNNRTEAEVSTNQHVSQLEMENPAKETNEKENNEDLGFSQVDTSNGNITDTMSSSINQSNQCTDKEENLSLNSTKSFKTPTKEVGRSDTNQEEDDGKTLVEIQPEMPKGGFSDENPEAMESDVTNDEFQTKRKRRKRKNRGKQKDPADQPLIPEYSKPPAKETKDANAGHQVPAEKAAPGGSNTLNWGEVLSRKTTARCDYQHITFKDVKSGWVETNHFPIKFKNLPAVFHHYDVKFVTDKKHFQTRLMKEFIKIHCKNCNPVFDDACNLYSAFELFTDKTKEFDIPLETRNTPQHFKVTVTLVNMISTEPLRNLKEGMNVVSIPQQIIQCLNIVLGYALRSLGYKSIDEMYISETTSGHPLPSGMEMKRGLFQSVVFGKKLFLNIYAKQKAFPAQQSVIETISQLLSIHNLRVESKLNASNKTRLESFLKGLRVEYKMKDDRRRTYFVTKLGLPSNEAVFDQNGTEITVERYFQNERNETLSYPNLPCLSVQYKPGQQGLRENPILLPPEYCKIMGGKLKGNFLEEVSANMIEYSGPPQERKVQTIQSFPHAKINQNDCLQEFGISVVNIFEKITSKILTPPSLVYNGNQMARPTSSAQWYLTKFHTDAARTSPITWAIIDLTRYSREENLEQFKKKMYEGCKEAGLTIEKHTSKWVTVIKSNIKYLQNHLEKMKNYNFVFVIIPDDGNDYGKIKSIAENSVGCLTQCLKLKTFNKIIHPKCNRSLTDNIAQKINAKLNGTNHVLAEGQLFIKWPFMIMGADVTHPTSSTGGNSIAAVTASYDRNAFQYNIYSCSQDPRMETIEVLGDLTRDQLKYFQKKNRKELPSTILFYRDGVSDGQFASTYQAEIRAIKKTCSEFQPGYQPKITFLVVQKRHHTRFFPLNTRQEAGSRIPSNVPVGTCVDTVITNSTNLTFYLLSHHTNDKKLARPSKYVLLHDDNNFNIDHLENLTFRFCHLFSRCTKSVSYPAPTYYAHLAAARIKAYGEGKQPEQNELDDPNITFKDAHPMFFV